MFLCVAKQSITLLGHLWFKPSICLHSVTCFTHCATCSHLESKQEQSCWCATRPGVGRWNLPLLCGFTFSTRLGTITWVHSGSSSTCCHFPKENLWKYLAGIWHWQAIISGMLCFYYVVTHSQCKMWLVVPQRIPFMCRIIAKVAVSLP